MKKKGLLSFFVYTLTAIIFSLSALITVFLGSLGWLLSEWDPLELSNSTNNIGLCIMPAIFCLSFTITFCTVHILITHDITNSRKKFMGYGIFSTAIGLFVLGITPLGITLSRLKTSNAYSSWTKELLKSISRTPFLETYLGFFVLFTLMGFYLAWHKSSPKNEDELTAWREYADRTKVHSFEWVSLYSFIVIFVNFILPLPFIFFNTAVSIDDVLIIQGLITFFPGFFLFICAFIIFNWRIIRIKLDLFRIDHQIKIKSDKIGEQASQEEIKFQKRKLQWRDFLVLGGLELGFFIIFFFLLFSYWIEVVILSLWALIFLSVLILLPHV